MTTPDPYARVEYRRLIAWPARIEREWPMLSRVLASGPSRRVLDLEKGRKIDACLERGLRQDDMRTHVCRSQDERQAHCRKEHQAASHGPAAESNYIARFHTRNAPECLDP